MSSNLADNLLLQISQDKAETEDHEPTEENEACDCQEVGYGTGDAVFASFVVAPMVVSVWRGTWGIMELHPVLFPHAQIYTLGIVIHVCFALIRTPLLLRSQNAWGEGRAGRWLRERILSRIYTYIFIIACIMHWRGGWGLFDAVIVAVLPDDEDPHRPVLIAALTLLLYLLVSALRSSRNLLASPYFLVTDGKEPTYGFTTRFQNKDTDVLPFWGLSWTASVLLLLWLPTLLTETQHGCFT